VAVLQLVPHAKLGTIMLRRAGTRRADRDWSLWTANVVRTAFHGQPLRVSRW
jgi:hypothetical protein